MAKNGGGNGAGSNAVAARGKAKPSAKAPKPSNGSPSRSAKPSKAKEHHASIYPGPGVPVAPELIAAVQHVEAAMGGMTVWLLVQDPMAGPSDPFSALDGRARNSFFAARHDLAGCKGPGVVLVLDSLGGYARESYQIAKLLRRHCGSFVVVVPRAAKSAATLLALGADDLFLGRDAELGPIDAQLFDYEAEERSSALDEVQALERLHAVALDQFEQTMAVLWQGTRKKYSTLLPLALKFTSDMMAPLLAKIDTVHYAKQSRVLKVAEDYAVRLLQPKYSEERAKEIASQLVNRYSEHEFVIDRDETGQILDLAPETDEQTAAIAELEDYLAVNRVTVVGTIKEGL